MHPDAYPLGATPLPGGRCAFLVWAPAAERVDVALGRGRAERLEPLERGYHGAVLDDVTAAERYGFALDGGAPSPDPASRSQPEGVFGPSEVVDPAAVATGVSGGVRFENPPLAEHVLYELHVGTFTPAGTFAGVVERLDDLADLGVTAVELMPVAQFPGTRNWGYDGVFPFAPHDAYGGPAGLASLVDACHRRGLAAFLDVVHNHVGPEGGVHAAFGPYLSDRYRTLWGNAFNLDGPGSDEVRRYLIESALGWLEGYRIDGLRLDAVHAIIDATATPFLAELSAAVEDLEARTGRRIHLVAETPDNDPRVVAAREAHGLGMDAVWSDDVHHAIHVAVTGERDGYYADYRGLEDVAAGLRDGWVLQGRRSPFRDRRHGGRADAVPADRIVVYTQNHDQVGNRQRGDRLAATVPFETQQLLAGLLLLAPAVPLLFMGQEYGETAPFGYFTSHASPELAEAVRRGRRDEFAGFGWDGEAPRPQAEETFLASVLDHDLRTKGDHAALLALHRELLRLRRTVPALARPSKEGLEVAADEAAGTIVMRRRAGRSDAFAAFSFGEDRVDAPLPPGDWAVALDAADARWRADGPSGGADPTGRRLRGSVGVAPRSFVLLLAEVA